VGAVWMPSLLMLMRFKWFATNGGAGEVLRQEHVYLLFPILCCLQFCVAVVPAFVGDCYSGLYTLFWLLSDDTHIVLRLQVAFVLKCYAGVAEGENKVCWVYKD
jgi:hypothetical protein